MKREVVSVVCCEGLDGNQNFDVPFFFERLTNMTIWVTLQ